MTDKNIFNKSLDIAQGIIENGGEISRAEDTAMRINSSKGQSCSIFALPTLIIAGCGDDVQIRRIHRYDTDLAELVRLNALSRNICGSDNFEHNSFSEYHKLINAFCIFGATFSFSVFFGGNTADGICAGLIGLIITYSGYKRLSFPQFSANLVDSFIAGLMSFIPQLLGADTHYDKIIIGTIMLLVPGLTVVNAMRDMMKADIFAGIAELFNAVISALAIALGVAGALLIFHSL